MENALPGEFIHVRVLKGQQKKIGFGKVEEFLVFQTSAMKILVYVLSAYGLL